MKYEINKNTLIIIPINETKSRVVETDCEYVVEDTPYSIMEHSCVYFGSSFSGRVEGSKGILGTIYKAPIIVEDSMNIIFFPTNSYCSNKNIWISLNNIDSYKKYDDKTMINFKDNNSILIDVPYYSVDNQVLRSTRMESILKRRRNS